MKGIELGLNMNNEWILRHSEASLTSHRKSDCRTKHYQPVIASYISNQIERIIEQ
jgi:hypothetical protein